MTVLLQNFVAVARRLSYVLVGSSSPLTTMIDRFLSRVTGREKMATAPSQPASQQLQSLLDTGMAWCALSNPVP